MNYRHAYHAGNHAEVLKHSALVLLIHHLRRKPRPFMVLDTHAGAGIYDLTSPPAMKTGEAGQGIGRVFGKALVAATPYLKIIRELNPQGLIRYPGSPAITRELLRDQDRLVACELHDDDAALLRSHFRGDPQVSVHHRDGYEAVLAFVPPPENRGLIFLDPPFEATDELERLANAIQSAAHKWPNGMVAAWYPIKSQRTARAFRMKVKSRLSSNLLCMDFLLFPNEDARLAGSGMLFYNPPWQFDQALKDLCSELLNAFEAPRGQWSVEWLRPPR